MTIEFLKGNWEALMVLRYTKTAPQTQLDPVHLIYDLLAQVYIQIRYVQMQLVKC